MLLDNALRHGAGATVVSVGDGIGWARCASGTTARASRRPRRRSCSSAACRRGNGGGGVGLAVARELVRREGGELALVHARPPCFEAAVPAA